MHEMSLAGGILQVVEDAAAREHFKRVSRLTLEAGPLAGVEVHALRFALEALQPGTLLEGATIEIDEPPATAWCMACSCSVAIASRADPCPHCGGWQLTPTGVSLLAIPRAPMSWYCAVAEGTFAREEASFNLFATSAIRQIRSSTGDPFAVVSSCSDGTIRIDLRSPFDEMEARSHVWVLDVHHDLDRVERSIVDLLKECRLDDVRLSPEIAAPLPLHPAGLAGRLLS